MFGFVFLTAIVLVAGYPSAGSLEETEFVTVEELETEAERFDGKRVHVTGKVRSIQTERGRRGSPFFFLVLEPITNSPKEEIQTVNVFALALPQQIEKGERVSVEGVYHLEGREAGRILEHFIRAEEIRSADAVFS